MGGGLQDAVSASVSCCSRPPELEPDLPAKNGSGSSQSRPGSRFKLPYLDLPTKRPKAPQSQRARSLGESSLYPPGHQRPHAPSSSLLLLL